MYIIYVKTIFKVYKKPYTGFTWSLGATNGINYWIFILGSGWVDPGRTQVRHWTHWLTQGLTLGQMVLSSRPDPIWPGQLGSGRRSTRVKRVLTWPAATLVALQVPEFRPPKRQHEQALQSSRSPHRFWALGCSTRAVSPYQQYLPAISLDLAI